MSQAQNTPQIPPQLVSAIKELARLYAPEDIQEEMDIDGAETPSELMVVMLRAGIARIADDVRERREGKPSGKQVRQKIDQMSVEQQENLRDSVWTELIGGMIAGLQHGDRQGFQNIKSMIRDPYAVEGLLLEFRLEGEEPSEDFIRDVLTFLGMSLFPRMYSDEEIEQKGDRLNRKFMGG